MKNQRQRRSQDKPVELTKRSPTCGPNNRRAYLPELRSCRLMAALSQRELAQKIGTHQSTICDLENLNRAGYPATIRRLSEALEVEPAVLLYGKHYQDLN